MEHYSQCIEGKVLELFKKRGTVANHEEARFRFRKPPLCPAELRDHVDIASEFLGAFGFCSDFAPLRKPPQLSF